MKNKIKIPTTPNYIICNGVARPVSEYDQSALELIAEEWKENLLRKGRKERYGTTKEITL
jgi:hypothetical protein